MSASESPGKALHSENDEARREAARLLGMSRSERKIAAARAVAVSRRKENLTDEQRQKLRDAQKARRERERLARASDETAPVEKRPPGRPRTLPLVSAETPKRPVGRPRKQQEEPRS